MGKKLVVGIGNLILKDEGVGVHVIKALEGCPLPPDVELVDGGTAGYDLLPFLTGAEKIIIVDALLGGGPPGSVYLLTPEECWTQQKNATISLHDLGILPVLWDLALLEGKLPPCLIIGVEPEEYEELGLELTPAVAASIPKIIELIKKELQAEM